MPHVILKKETREIVGLYKGVMYVGSVLNNDYKIVTNSEKVYDPKRYYIRSYKLSEDYMRYIPLGVTFTTSKHDIKYTDILWVTKWGKSYKIKLVNGDIETVSTDYFIKVLNSEGSE